jgi:hypothetical protein
MTDTRAPLDHDADAGSVAMALDHANITAQGRTLRLAALIASLKQRREVRRVAHAAFRAFLDQCAGNGR